MATIRDHIREVLTGRNCPMNPMEFHMTSRLRYTPDQLRCAMEAMTRDGQLQRIGKDQFAPLDWRAPEKQEAPAKLTAADEQELVHRVRARAAKEQEPTHEEASSQEQTTTKQEDPVTDETQNNQNMRAQVLAAIEAGCTTYDEICARTGIERDQAHWAVKGLRRTEKLVKIGENRWAVAGKAGDLIEQHPALEAIDAVRRRVTYKIRDKEIKLRCLAKLGRIMDPSITKVLEDIAEDLRAVG